MFSKACPNIEDSISAKPHAVKPGVTAETTMSNGALKEDHGGAEVREGAGMM